MAVLRLGRHHNSKYELKRFQNLAQHLSFPTLPKLKHLDIKLTSCNDAEVASFMGSMRCLRKFSCSHRNKLGSLTLPVFRSHFHTITDIQLLGVDSFFWKEVLSSCPVLRYLDIVFGDPPFVDGRNIERRSVSYIQDIELALFKRISCLVNLETLDIEERLPQPQFGPRPKVSEVKGLEMLSDLSFLKELRLGAIISPYLGASTCECIQSYKALKSLKGTWSTPSSQTPRHVRTLREHGVDVYWSNEEDFSKGLFGYLAR
ncbi:hypothetical protein BGX28_007596 [Mortierella sp. GBA30]|nr:hypothetical protein BGX28_007596 [Mortierella sp. GBA30]